MKKLILLLTLLFLNVTSLWAQFGPPPSGPIADFVEVSGTLEVGETLTGSYEYNDPDGFPEDGSTYQWYRADDEFGSGWTAITGATDTLYTLVVADDGKYISFEVTPSNGTDTGMPAESMLEGPVGGGSGGGGNTPPVASNVSFSGTLEVGSTITGSYDYSDADSDPESGSVYTWNRSDDGAGSGKTPIPTADAATYTLTSTDEGKYISFSVIPGDGTDAGTQEESALQGPVAAEPTTPAVSFAGGTGSEADPYQVATLEQLQALKDGPSLHFVLNNDLDASATSTWNSGEGFVPIGGSSPFTGSFDGQGFVITGLTVNRSTEDYAGLFAVIGDGGSVKNIGLEQLSITGGGNTGGLAGENNGTISGSYADGDVDGSAIVGGLVGLNNSSITESYSAGTVDGTQDIGGLVGLHSLGTISESYSTSDATGTANNVGGLIGFSYDNVENSFATGSVSGDTNVGGFAGNYNSGTVSNSYSTGAVTGSSNVGGFIGQKNSFAAASNSFWDTQTSGQAAATGIGSTTGITVQTTTEMQTQSTFTDAGWDFTDIWVMSGYPSLKAFVGNTAPVVINAVADFSVNEDSSVNPISFTDVFSDSEDNDADLTYTLVSNSNPSLVFTSVDNTQDILVILLQSNANGAADFTIQAEDSEGLTEQESFTLTVNPVNDNPTGTVTITGTAKEDETLTASNDLADADGLGTISYQWQRDGVDITGATDSTYTLVQSDIGTVITVVANYTDGEGTSESEISAPTATVVSNNTPPVVTSVTMVGEFKVGETITAEYTYTDAEGDAVSASYVWVITDYNSASDTDVGTGSTYTIKESDLLKKLSVRVSINDGKASSGYPKWSAEHLVHSFESGLGTEESPYIITTADQLNAIRDVNTTTDQYDSNVDDHFKLGSDIDLDVAPYNQGEGWVPVSRGAGINFTGTLNGNNHAIDGLYINNSTNEYVGLIGFHLGTVQNLKLTNVNVTASNDYVTGAIGYVSGGTVSNVHVTGSVTSTFTSTGGVGGIAGALWNDGSITESSFDGTVTGTVVGGIAGDIESDGDDNTFISKSYSTGSVSGERAGGIVGSVTDGGTISDSYSLATVSGSTYEGGIIGYSVATQTHNYFAGTLSGVETNALWNSNGIETSGLTKSAMRDSISFANAGFDFTNTWAIVTGDSISYPYLRANQQTPIPGIAEATPKFLLAENGVTVTCNEASPNDIGILNGTTYKALSEDSLRARIDVDQDVANVCTSLVTNMARLFVNNSNFNQDISTWDVSKVTNMYDMFYSTNAFNGNIGSWDVSSVNNMGYMFSGASAFNQDISAWDVSSVNDMVQMFGSAISFNQPIGDWDVSNVVDMGGMFHNATSFDQNLGNWNISNVYSFYYDVHGDAKFMVNTNLSTQNYDSLLIGWANLDSLTSGLTIHFGDVQYSPAAIQARAKLTGAPNNWNISDGGLKNNPPVFPIPFNISTAEYTGADKDLILPEEGLNDPYGITFSKDGMKLFLVGYTNDVVKEYSLGAAYDPSTAEYNGIEFSVSGQGEDPFKLVFNNEGTKMFVLDRDGVNEYKLEAEYDITSAVFTGNRSTIEGIGVLRGLRFDKHGKKMFVIGYNSKSVMEYTLGTAYDLSTAEYAGAEKDFYIGDQMEDPRDLLFGPEGNTMIVLDFYNQLVEYSLQTAYDLSSAEYTENKFPLTGTIGYPIGVSSNREGTNLFVLSLGGDFLNRLTTHNLASGTPRSVSFTENTTGTVIDVQATDGEGGATDAGITYSIIGGADADFFAIDGATGEITFKTAPDFGSPADADADNMYEVTVQADDGQSSNNTASISLAISVSDVEDNTGFDPLVTTTLISPADEATDVDLKPTFKWNSLQGVSGYDLMGSLNENFSDSMVVKGITDTTYTLLNELEMGVTFHWRVRGTTDSDSTAWSEPFSFTITQPNKLFTTVDRVTWDDGGTETNVCPDGVDVGGVITVWITITDDNEKVYTDADSEILQAYIPGANISAGSDVLFVYDSESGLWKASFSLTKLGDIDYVVDIPSISDLTKPSASFEACLSTFVTERTFALNLDLLLKTPANNFSNKESASDESKSKQNTAPFILGLQRFVDDGTGNQVRDTLKVVVDWGDGTIEYYEGLGYPSHVYSETKDYNIRVAGNHNSFKASAAKKQISGLTSVSNWGETQWKDLSNAFEGAINLNLKAEDSPDLSEVKSLNQMFKEARSFNADIGNWDVSQITNMASMFQGAKAFNQDISSWDISNVKYFDVAPDTTNKQAKVNTTTPGAISGFLVGSGLSSENASKMFVGWKDKINTVVQSINIGKIELDAIGAAALKEVQQATGIQVSWGGQEGVDDEPVFAELPNPFEIATEDTRILKLWDYVSDVATPDNELEFKFSIISDSVETVGFDNTNGELAITSRAQADTFFVAIQVANNQNIVSLDTLEVRADPSFITSAEMMAALPDEFELNQNYPNPFNPTTVIRYGVPQSSEVRLEVFDMLGRKVATLVNGERQRAGWHQVNFDASRLASGMYLYRIVAGKHVQTRKMMLIK
ncbi:BspA family leucine-rich repeat surface protein [Gracilimonas sp.]|uniref:BspA family leucine-rich repeat surface protein n=1 Tax=Gracilimonas sp. TaxID=1974203 RepID=UPI003D10613A